MKKTIKTILAMMLISASFSSVMAEEKKQVGSQPDSKVNCDQISGNTGTGEASAADDTCTPGTQGCSEQGTRIK